MHWKIIAVAFGWRLARDDEEGLYVVWHPKLRRHFAGEDGWKDAVFFSIRSPCSFRRDGRR